MIEWFNRKPSKYDDRIRANVAATAFSSGFGVARVGVLIDIHKPIIELFIEHSFWARMLFPERCSLSLRRIPDDIRFSTNSGVGVKIESNLDE